jgi:hypothetical protein
MSMACPQLQHPARECRMRVRQKLNAPYGLGSYARQGIKLGQAETMRTSPARGGGGEVPPSDLKLLTRPRS